MGIFCERQKNPFTASCAYPSQISGAPPAHLRPIRCARGGGGYNDAVPDQYNTRTFITATAATGRAGPAVRVLHSVCFPWRHARLSAPLMVEWRPPIAAPWSAHRRPPLPPHCPGCCRTWTSTTRRSSPSIVSLRILSGEWTDTVSAVHRFPILGFTSAGGTFQKNPLQLRTCLITRSLFKCGKHLFLFASSVGLRNPLWWSWPTLMKFVLQFFATLSLSAEAFKKIDRRHFGY